MASVYTLCIWGGGGAGKSGVGVRYDLLGIYQEP